MVEKIKSAKSLTFANYHGLTAGQIAQLRAKVKDAGGEFLVEKNTLIKLVLRTSKLEVPKEQLTGPTAAILSYEDEITPIKQIAQSNKEVGSPTFKFGFLGKDWLDPTDLENLAKIPGRDQLNANLVGALASPIYGIVSTLQANIRNLVYVLDQVAQKNKGLVS